MFAVTAQVPVRVEEAFKALQRLAEEHKDGWGVARFDGQEPWVETSVHQASRCRRFASHGEAETRSLLAHIRLASVGTVQKENTHPFFARGFAFMHNGTTAHFARSRAKLEAELSPRRRAELKGDTDSERCFALFLTYLEDVADPSLTDLARALVRVLDTVARICDVPGEEQRSSLNFLVSDGRRFVATRRGRTLFSAVGDGARFIASEALLAEPEWTPVPEDGVVTIDADLTLRRWTLEDFR